MIKTHMEWNSLYRWQCECLASWEEEDFRGIAEVTTGAGKTRMAAFGCRKLLEKTGGQLWIYVIVPKTALKKQWRNTLLEAGIDDVTIWSSGKRREGKATIFTVNTARHTVSLLIQEHCVRDKASFWCWTKSTTTGVPRTATSSIS